MDEMHHACRYGESGSLSNLVVPLDRGALAYFLAEHATKEYSILLFHVFTLMVVVVVVIVIVIVVVVLKVIKHYAGANETKLLAQFL